MHVQHITEQELADLLYDAIDLSYEPCGTTRGIGADVREFVVFQGDTSAEIVLVSELPVPVMPPDPTPEQLAEFRRMIDEARAREAGAA